MSVTRIRFSFPYSIRFRFTWLCAGRQTHMLSDKVLSVALFVSLGITSLMILLVVTLPSFPQIVTGCWPLHSAWHWWCQSCDGWNVWVYFYFVRLSWSSLLLFVYDSYEQVTAIGADGIMKDCHCALFVWVSVTLILSIYAKHIGRGYW